VGPLSDSDIAALSKGGLDLRPEDRTNSGDHERPREAGWLGQLLSTREAAALLRIGTREVRRRIRQRTLLALQSGRAWQIPAFQFVGNEPIRGLDAVLQAVPPDLHPVEVVGWLSATEPDLEIAGAPVSPLKWLKAGGDPTRAAAIAHDL
jgi:excisionase family DNA binding protein